MIVVLKKLEDIRLSLACKGDGMAIHYEVKDERLKEMLVKKAKELHITLDTLIWNYINRGLMDDNLTEETFEEVHSEKFLREVDEALGLD